MKLKCFFKITRTSALGSPNEVALFRIESRLFSRKLRSTRSMFAGVIEDRLGPDRGSFFAEAVARNLFTQERIKFTLGLSFENCNIRSLNTELVIRLVTLALFCDFLARVKDTLVSNGKPHECLNGSLHQHSYTIVFTTG